MVVKSRHHHQVTNTRSQWGSSITHDDLDVQLVQRCSPRTPTPLNVFVAPYAVLQTCLALPVSTKRGGFFTVVHKQKSTAHFWNSTCVIERRGNMVVSKLQATAMEAQDPMLQLYRYMASERLRTSSTIKSSLFPLWLWNKELCTELTIQYSCLMYQRLACCLH